MTVLVSLGMRLFMLFLYSSGLATHSGCHKPLDVTPNTCYVVTAYRADYTWASMDYYRVDDTTYRLMWTVRR